jgi:hypothetical protein
LFLILSRTLQRNKEKCVQDEDNYKENRDLDGHADFNSWTKQQSGSHGGTDSKEPRPLQEDRISDPHASEVYRGHSPLKMRCRQPLLIERMEFILHYGWTSRPLKPVQRVS